MLFLRTGYRLPFGPNIGGLSAPSEVMNYAPRPEQLTVWETFKVNDGQIHAVEAFMKLLPVTQRNGGWE
jgi:hypothetical protein